VNTPNVVVDVWSASTSRNGTTIKRDSHFNRADIYNCRTVALSTWTNGPSFASLAKQTVRKDETCGCWYNQIIAAG
jgi:hypothetical protein